MLLTKTEKAADELRSKQRTLGQKERTLLLLADGKKSAAELQTLVQVNVSLITQLITDGYLTYPKNTPPATRSDKVSADPFHGNRSLATARIFLMDLAERFFARQNPEFSALIRAQLRTAPDQDAVVSIAQTLLLQLEAVAGSERAEGIRERLDRLWPIQELNSEIK